MEKKFLVYVLYITLIEFRSTAYKKNDKRTFWLCDLLHNIPYSLESEEAVKLAYDKLIADVEHLGIQEWIKARKQEFYSRHPEYKVGE